MVSTVPSIGGFLLSFLLAVINHSPYKAPLQNKLKYFPTSPHPQGTVIGPLLFLMYINNVPDGLKSRTSLFADDCIICHPISSVDDCNVLQIDLKLLENWGAKWLMSCKPEECNTFSFSRRRNRINFDYELSGHVLQTLNQHKYLGVILPSTMKWNAHIDKAVFKASSMIYFLRRNLCIGPEMVKIQAYKGLVRPPGEYCSSVWDPHIKSYIQKLEAVQRRAARSITNDNGCGAQLATCTPTWSFLSYSKDVSATD